MFSRVSPCTYVIELFRGSSIVFEIDSNVEVRIGLNAGKVIQETSCTSRP